MKKLFVRTGIILFWVALLFCFLYWPKWKIIPYEEKSINVFAWGDILEPSVVADFERETGIKIHLNYYSSNEELLVKLKATKGEGYDLIIPSDYAVNVLIKEDLLKEIDKEKLSFWSTLNPALLDHSFDPDNHYSIPFEWELFGFGIDREYFQVHPMTPSWQMLFTPELFHYKVTMNNDPIEALQFASFYLYGSIDQLNAEQAQAVKQLLIQQKPSVAAYANFRGDYFLATKNVALVIASSSYILRTKRLFDFVDFVVPKEGSFVTIESFCIPKLSQKEKLVYRFINYLCRPQSIVTHFNTYALFPASLHALDMLNLDSAVSEWIQSSEENFKQYHFIRRVLPQQEMLDIWVDVKSSRF